MGSFEIFIANHQLTAYLILLGGMFIDSDIFYLSAALLAHSKQLNWFIVAGIAFGGMILSDICFYFLGRYSRETRFGTWFTRKFKKYHEWLDVNFIGRYTVFAFFGKFVAYVNRIGPFLAGWHKLPYRKFLKIHFATGLLWLSILTTIGVILGSFIDLVGIGWVLHRIWAFVIILFLTFIIGSRIMGKVLTKKFEAKENINTDNQKPL
ncbi:MAG: hypothetical protein COU07_03610 [Candidatus Harrisonbacteria bacterium CG10_big_fil_rev_8_21_14_0_10_40_38]|uniref:DedA family protein n=1 Tax=Candidatus Harrisonbacteria bacterium CG10_big_fil_rev_8_21_14_0_10_40_38 TaxID=1974583 RepID=A0A2H0URC3_9BACT|nr:MAG: hypothetical protein COU07_03610 [Candidatus Harrisonbacteria bacterium CG10_big_fil_rev_8_21_14_0_10_40_38]